MFPSSSAGQYDSDNIKQQQEQKQSVTNDDTEEHHLLTTPQHQHSYHHHSSVQRHANQDHSYSITHHHHHHHHHHQQEQPQPMFQPSNSTSSISEYYTIPPPQQQAHYAPYTDYNIRIPIQIEHGLHPSLNFIPHTQDQTTMEQERGLGNEDQQGDNYDPTLTPVPSSTVLPVHRSDEQVMMLLSSSSSWETENVIPSHRLDPTTAVSVAAVAAVAGGANVSTTPPIPSPQQQQRHQQQQRQQQRQQQGPHELPMISTSTHSIVHDASLDRHQQEQELFGRLVSMASQQSTDLQPQQEQQQQTRQHHSSISWQQQQQQQQQQQGSPWLSHPLPDTSKTSSNLLMPPASAFRTSGSSSTTSSTTTAHELDTSSISFTSPSIQNPSPINLPESTIIGSSAWQRKDEREYRLEIVQQPSRARMCGFGDKDRRPISPPPILKLLVRTHQGILLSPQDIDTSFFVILCDCFDATGANPANMILHSIPISSSSSAGSSSRQQQEQEQQSIITSSSVAPPSSSTVSTTAAQTSASSSSTTNKTTVKMKNLVGSCIASPSKLYNEQGEFGIYFVFHDLSLRSEGRFRLVFSLIDISSPDSKSVNTQSISHIVTTTTSDIFTAFTAKNFPGVVPPTQLSQCFAKQGVKIPTRRDTKSKRMRKSAEINKEDKQQQQPDE